MSAKYSALLGFAVLLLVLYQVGQNQKPQQNGYNVQLSKQYAGYAILSYCPRKCLQSWTCKTAAHYPKLTHVTHINNLVTLAAVYVGYQPNSRTVFISWRGSSNAQNWIEDFTIAMQPFGACEKCYIHVGFHLDYKLNQKKVNEALDDLIREQEVAKIVITGHSMGAALATVNGLYLSLRINRIPIEVHNFGSPRIFNRNLAEFTHLKVPNLYRVVHNRDLIPHLPPEVEYRHTAFQVLFDKGMQNYQVCDGSGEDDNCSNKFFPNYVAADHDLYFVDTIPRC